MSGSPDLRMRACHRCFLMRTRSSVSPCDTCVRASSVSTEHAKGESHPAGALTCSCGARPPMSTGRVGSKFCTHSGGIWRVKTQLNIDTAQNGRATHIGQLKPHVAPRRCPLVPVSTRRSRGEEAAAAARWQPRNARDGLRWCLGRELRTIQGALRAEYQPHTRRRTKTADARNTQNTSTTNTAVRA